MDMDITGGQDFDPEDGFWVRNRTALIAGCLAVLVLGVGAFFVLRTAEAPPPPPVQKITIIAVQPPKPPPPPPPPIQQQMIQQPKITTPLEKPEQPAPPTKVAPPKAAAPAAAPMGTSIKGNTPNNFDLSGSGSGDGLLGGGGGGGGSGAWSYYASQLQDAINVALQKNKHTSHASFQVTARIWVDASGRPTRALVAPSGDAGIDAAIQNEVLAGTHYPPPPAGMPMPIVISLTGEQPL